MLNPPTLFLILGIVLLLGCSPKNAVPAVDRQVADRTGLNGLEYYAKDYFGEDYAVEWNEAKAHALVHKSVSVGREGMEPTLHLFLYSATADTVVFRDAVPRGRVAWVGSDRFQVRSTPGMVRGNRSSAVKNGYLYDVKKGQKQLLSNQP